MRSYSSYIGLFGVLILGACGGDDDGDITTPNGDSFTLAVTGGGTGSGRVVSAPGASPAIDCTLVANAEPVGTCTGTYSEGTVVPLTVTPDPGSSFAGWEGDAASCSIEPSCSVTMEGNRSAVAQFSAATAGSVEITSSAWYPDTAFGVEPGIVWVVEVRNNSSQFVDPAEILFSSRDAAGNVLASDFLFVGPIPPGETRANESFASYFGNEASIDVQVGEVTFSEDPGFAGAQIVSSNWQVAPGDEGGQAIVWTVEVQNTTSTELESVLVDFVTYDAGGKILEYDFTFVGPIAPGERAVGEGLAELRGGEANVEYEISAVTVADS